MSTIALAAQQSAPREASDDVTLKQWLAVIGCAIGAFMAVLDIQITSSSLREIQGGLGASVDEGSWISTSYLIAEIVTIPLTGWLSEALSPKIFLMAYATLFTLFSMCCGFSSDLQTMIIFRALQGFTGGVLIPMCFSTILTTLPKSKQPIGMALFALTATFAPSIGPAVGGYITDAAGWRYIFFINLMPGIGLVALLFYALPSLKPKLELLRRSDIPGIISIAIGLSCLIYVLEEGQRNDWFGSETIQRAAAISFVSLTFFVVRELVAKYPLVNIRLMLRKNFAIATTINIGLGIALYATIYLVPMYLAQVQGYSAWQIGQVLIWSGLPQLLIIPCVPFLMQKIDARLMLFVGFALFGASCLMNVFMSHDYAGPQLVASMLERALGQALIITPLSAIATADIEPEQTGSASSLLNMLRNLGGSVGTACSSTLVTQREQFHSVRIGEHVTASDPVVGQWLAQVAAGLHHQGATHWTSAQQALQLLAGKIRLEAFVMAFNDAFAFVSVVLFAAAVLCILLDKPEGELNMMSE